MMTPPDSSTILIVVVNILGYAAVFYKNRVTSYQHKLMWKYFARVHKINGNGNSEEN